MDSECQITVEYSGKKKLVLPSFCVYKGQEFFCFPYRRHPLFNRIDLGFSPEAIVILTDSIEIAVDNQSRPKPFMDSKIVWISWYNNDEDNIEAVDWTPLQGRQVYYLLKVHSGFSIKSTCRRALAVGKKLSSLGVSIRYVSTLKDGKKYPIMVTVEQIQDMAEGVNPTEISSSPKFDRLLISAPLSRDILFSPLIHERTVTLLHGPPGAGKTTFALSMAFALSMGLELFNGWRTQKPAIVLYLHAHSGDAEIIHGLFQVVCQLDKSKILNPSKPLANIPILEEQCFAIYPPQFFGYEVPARAATDVWDPRVVFSTRLMEGIINFVKGRPDLSQPVFIVLDGFNLRTRPSASQTWNTFLKMLKNLDVSTLIIPDSNASTENNISELIRHFPLDTVMKIEAEMPSNAKAIAMAVHIRKGFRLGADETEHLRLELDLTTPAWKIVKEKRSWLQELALVKELKQGNQMMSTQEIADALGISLPMAKKRLRQLRGLNLPSTRRLKQGDEAALQKWFSLPTGKKKPRKPNSSSSPARNEQPTPPDGNLPNTGAKAPDQQD